MELNEVKYVISRKYYFNRQNKLYEWLWFWKTHHRIAPLQIRQIAVTAVTHGAPHTAVTPGEPQTAVTAVTPGHHRSQ